MNTFTARDIVRKASDWTPLVEAADRALQALAARQVEAPIRTSLPLPEGELITMPGRIHGAGTAIVKLLTVVPRNPAAGRPMIQGTAVLFDAETGETVALFDGAALTAVRTAAVSAAAARALAHGDASSLALLGAGGQAAWQIRALTSVLPIDRVTVWSPTESRRTRLARQLARELKAEVRDVGSCAEATRDARVICCSTTARTAFLHADMLSSGDVLVVAIGAYRPDMAEVGPSVFRLAGRVYADDVDAVLHEAGDVLDAIRQGALTRDAVLPIGSALTEQTHPRSRVTVFKSVGSAVQDAAVAEALLAS